MISPLRSFAVLYSPATLEEFPCLLIFPHRFTFTVLPALVITRVALLSLRQVVDGKSTQSFQLGHKRKEMVLECQKTGMCKSKAMLETMTEPGQDITQLERR